MATRNAAGRLPGGEPCEVAPHARFGKGEQETGPIGTAPAPHFVSQHLAKTDLRHCLIFAIRARV